MKICENLSLDRVQTNSTKLWWVSDFPYDIASAGIISFHQSHTISKERLLERSQFLLIFLLHLFLLVLFILQTRKLFAVMMRSDVEAIEGRNCLEESIKWEEVEIVECSNDF